MADALPRAEQAIAAAEAALTAGQQAVAAGANGQAVGPVHACEAAVTAAQTLLDGVGQHEQRLAAADTEVPRLLAEVDEEVARLQTVPPAELAAAGGGTPPVCSPRPAPPAPAPSSPSGPGRATR